jgi:5-formyltetrahydrofolate cyclo-ligase
VFGVQARVVGGKPDNPLQHPLETLSQGTGRMTAQVGDTLESKASQKQILRRRLRKLRAALDSGTRAQATAKATRRLLRLACVRRARLLGVYLETGSELSAATLRQTLVRRGVRLHVPVIIGDGVMAFVRLRHDTVLRRNRHAIAEPVARRPRVLLRQLDVLIMPLVGFDDRGFRLGAGGGYFDRLLESRRRLRRPSRIGLAFECQRLDALPQEPWDQPLDWIVTERCCRRASAAPMSAS